MPEKETGGLTTAKESAVRKLRRSLRITPLDRLMIDAVVDSRQGVTGALSQQDLTEAVDEFVNLNGRRQQSHFHVGFRDALFDLPFAADLAAENATRARWYWAGVVQGLARSQSWVRVAEVYDQNSTVRELGDGADRASRGSGVCVAEALWKTGRTAELQGFVGAKLAGRPEVYKLLLRAGTEALRARNPGVARAIFTLLMETADSPRWSGSIEQHAPTVRRRMAHCLRLLGEHRSAEDLLEGLLRDERDPGIHAMVHADLGLLKGRFALLDEVRVPDDEAAQRDLVDRLRAGEEHYRDAVADADAPFAGHGHYCLGVLSLVDGVLGTGGFEEADRHLERAHAQIRSREVYPTSLLAQIELYLGIAKTQLLDAGETHHAARLVASGLTEARIPPNFVGAMVDSLALSDDSLASIAKPLLDSGIDEVIDALTKTAMVTKSPLLSDRLCERARGAGRGKVLAAADLRRALPGYLRAGEIEKAKEVLDELEHLALGGIGGSKFLEMLGRSEGYDPAWEPEDAAVASARCLEGKGQLTEALSKLRGVFHSYMQKGETQDAEGVLDRIRAYGLEPADFADLERRYANSVDDDGSEEDEDADAVRPVTVLVVGGDETQAKAAERVRSKVAGREPTTTVEFLHTGWSSGWDQYLDEIERRLVDCDAVVVMRYIRTLLGKHVRALCGARDVPWRFCWSGGQGGITESVIAAAAAARVHGGSRGT